MTKAPHFPAILSAIVCSALLAPAAKADVGLVLNSSMGTGSSFLTSGGHASIYLSRICPVTAVEVRLCAPGEQGSVLSNYSNFHEDKPYAWNVIPVSVFLYGVDDAEDRPLFATTQLQTALRERYRAAHLGAFCQSDDCKTNPDANWTDMVGATFLRTVYIFEVKTTDAQDLAMVAWLNHSANVNHYHGMSHNCADFARDILNSYFPDAIQSHRFADFYVTSPKSTARSLTRYGERHKELAVRVTRFAQLPGTIRRSDPARSGFETVFASKKSLLPMLFRPEELGFIAAAYFVSDRFSAERATRRHSPDEALEGLQLAGISGERESHAVIAAGWNEFQSELERQVDEAREMGVIADDSDLGNTYAQIQRVGSTILDEDGRPGIEMPTTGETLAGSATLEPVHSSVVGITPRSTVRSDTPSTARLAYKFQLARVRFYLKQSGMHREALPEFRQDWELLQQTRDTVVRGRPDAAGPLEAAQSVPAVLPPDSAPPVSVVAKQGQ